MRVLDSRGTTLALGVLLPLAIFLGVVLRPGLDASPPGPSAAAEAPAPAQRSVRFLSAEDGTIRIEDASSGTPLRTLPPGDGGFLRGALRPLERERMRHGASHDSPYLLIRDSDGRLILLDPTSDLELDVAAFGRTNSEHFAALLPGGTGPPDPPS